MIKIKSGAEAREWRERLGLTAERLSPHCSRQGGRPMTDMDGVLLLSTDDDGNPRAVYQPRECEICGRRAQEMGTEPRCAEHAQ